MNRFKRLSLYYLVGYLAFGGVGLVAAPDVALKLLFSNGSYGDVMPRLAGMLMIALSAIVAQIIRHQVHGLYWTAVGVRVFLLTGLTALYFKSGDPLFLMLVGIVGLGVALTVTGALIDRRASR